jgi:ABC-2 type transport system ATP-binding protein
MSTAIETQSLYYRPGKGFELGDLSISVPEGSVYGFLGPNGSGKTTTIKLLLGLLRPQRGSITVLGREVPRRVAEVLAETGYVPEAPHLYRSLQVAQAIDYHCGFYEHWDAELAERLRERFYLPPRQRVSSLSKGETGKLMMLLALAQRPRLLVLDEPTDGLDPVVRRDILDALNDAVKRGDATVFMSSHLVHEIELICDWIAVMDRGTRSRCFTFAASPPSQGTHRSVCYDEMETRMAKSTAPCGGPCEGGGRAWNRTSTERMPPSQRSLTWISRTGLSNC